MEESLARFLREELGVATATGREWTVTTKLWRWQGVGKDGQPSSMSWFFLTIDADVAEAMRSASLGRTAAWGSVYVTARIGDTEWQTSAFPSKAVKGYLLPIKAAVRKATKIAENDMVTVVIKIG